MKKIYKITNKITGKIYIGKTTRELSDRFNEHLRNYERYVSGKYTHESKLYKSMSKYGPENFEIELVENFDDNVNLEEKEQYFIEKFNTIKCGYNISPGGLGGNLFGGHKHSEESRKKMSDINCWKGKHQPKDLIDKRSMSKMRYYECIKTGEIIFGKKNINHDFMWWVCLGKENKPIPEQKRLKIFNERNEIKIKNIEIAKKNLELGRKKKRWED